MGGRVVAAKLGEEKLLVPLMVFNRCSAQPRLSEILAVPLAAAFDPEHRLFAMSSEGSVRSTLAGHDFVLNSGV